MPHFNGSIEIFGSDGTVADTGVADLGAFPPRDEDHPEWSGTLTVEPGVDFELMEAPEAVQIRLSNGRTAQVLIMRVDGTGVVHVQGVGPPPF